MTSKKILPKELPFQQFEKIGLPKEQVLNLPKKDLQNLLKGNKTDIVALKVKDLDTTIDAKLSLIRNDDNSVSLKIHPFRKEINNDLGLSSSQLNQLKKGEIIEIQAEAKNKEMKKHFVQLDTSINELVSVLKENVKVPNKLDMDGEKIQLSNEQKEKIASGKEVSIKGKDGVSKVKLDLNNNAGIRIDSPEGYGRNNRLDVGTKKDLQY